ncbi:MAG: NAD(P)-dependent oxidoreductase, partial [Bacteroidota bacterium]
TDIMANDWAWDAFWQLATHALATRPKSLGRAGFECTTDNPSLIFGDIMDANRLAKEMKHFQPDWVVHLAARTDTDIYDLEADINEYIVNTLGTQNVLDAINACSSIKRAIITSTQFVCEAGYLPKHNVDYQPFTLYGKSKILTEQFTREANLSCKWAIIRPSTIWGPWALRYRDTMFRVMRKGLYFHPARKKVFRSYGYVKNVCFQIHRLLEIEAAAMHRDVFYVGDAPVNLLKWVKGIAQHLTGKNVRLLPTWMVKMIALTGDALKAFDIGFPLTTTRFNSMTQDYITPIEKTILTLGDAPYDMESGIKEMIDWYNDISADIQRPAFRMPEITQIPQSNQVATQHG